MNRSASLLAWRELKVKAGLKSPQWLATRVQMQRARPVLDVYGPEKSVRMYAVAKPQEEQRRKIEDIHCSAWVARRVIDPLRSSERGLQMSAVQRLCHPWSPRERPVIST